MTTLLTFLGVGKAERGYELARYRFDCGFDCETKLFASAAIKLLRQQERPPTRCIILGTTTSGWDNLYELVATLAPSSEPRALEWALAVSEEMKGQTAVPPERLREFEREFSSAIGLNLQLITVSNDGDEIFAALHTHLDEGSHVVVDVTHAFRTMPLNAVLALGALRWLKNIEVDDIVYGSYDTNTPTGAQRAYSLTTASRLARFTPELAKLELEGDVGGIAKVFHGSSPVLAKELRETQRRESLMQYEQSKHLRGQALGKLEKFASNTPFESVCAEATMAALKALETGVGAAAHLARAKEALKRLDYMRALALAKEALILRVIELKRLDVREKSERPATGTRGYSVYSALDYLAKTALKEQCGRARCPTVTNKLPHGSLDALLDARNSVMHAGTNLGENRAAKELLNEDALCDLLNWSFRFYDFLE